MEMKIALEQLLETIKADYKNWWSNYNTRELTDTQENMIAEFNKELHFKIGKKYIKIIRADGGQRSVWGFVVNTNDDKKFEIGDILKAASWAAPARNQARGNILEGGYNVQWTGPNYLK